MSSETSTISMPRRLPEAHRPVGGCAVWRYYDPATGQFLTVDPLVDATLSPYGYGGGDPIIANDPTGLCATLSGVGMSVVGDAKQPARTLQGGGGPGAYESLPPEGTAADFGIAGTSAGIARINMARWSSRFIAELTGMDVGDAADLVAHSAQLAGWEEKTTSAGLVRWVSPDGTKQIRLSFEHGPRLYASPVGGRQQAFGIAYLSWAPGRG